MDKIWDRNPSKSEVIGRCGEDEKTEWPRTLWFRVFRLKISKLSWVGNIVFGFLAGLWKYMLI